LPQLSALFAISARRPSPRRGAAARMVLLAWVVMSGLPLAHAEDGYDLWLRYRPVEAPWVERYRTSVSELVPPLTGGDAARSELTRAMAGLLGRTPATARQVTRDGAIVFGTPRSSAAVAGLHLDLHELGTEGYVLRSVMLHGHRATVIAANEDAGLIYGTFHFLRLLQTRQPIDRLSLRSSPRVQHRVLNHWDNLDGTVERGYAGASIWDWHKLPGYIAPRYVDYARACASIGINGTVVTNVNADALALSPMYLEKAAALAAVFRPYGLKVYLTARFTAPIDIGGLQTADPLDPAVRLWWQRKVDEIYRHIPDFGGFLVNANSEGQPGPQDYGRSHSDGANLFAAALAPHGGVVMWRAFVYSSRPSEDRTRQAYDEFVPLDGKFRANVLLQVKNGAIDFQPREPAHPLFGAMPRTPLMMEVQITKEYLGFATHLAYLGPLYEETLSSDTFAKGMGSTVAKVVDGSLHGYSQTGMAGVSNVGADRNWTGSHFDQANWYVFGRLAWDPGLASRDIAEEWVRMTFSNDARFVAPVVSMMMGSREAVVDYMTPLGLAHLMARGHHYGPGAWQSGEPRADWTPPYYHRADAQGVDFDRSAGGSNAVAQYAPTLAAKFNDPQLTPEKYLLWFHHLPWNFRMTSGRTLWDELVIHYSRGVDYVHQMRITWAALAPYVDSERYAQVSAFLAVQEKEARWWRDATLAYFQSISNLPFPAGYARPELRLEDYEAMSFPYAPGNPGWTAAPFLR
jgi:alpha-glucuronidase